MILCRIMASHLRHLALTRPPSNSCRKTKPKRHHEKVEPLKMGSAHVLSPEKDRNSTLYQWIKQSKKKNEKGTLIPFENQRRVARAARTQQATLQKISTPKLPQPVWPGLQGINYCNIALRKKRFRCISFKKHHKRLNQVLPWIKSTG